MGRTTICRSERAALRALVAGLLACGGLGGLGGPALAAQDTTQAAPAPAAQAPGQIPATHTVSKGETLWSIAQLYYNDPLLWPEIYRLNTALIDDPHWIYPGEELNLAGGVSVAAAPAESAAVGGPQAADTVHAQAVAPGADTVTAIAQDTTGMVDTTVVEAPPPPSAPESYQTIFDRRRTATEEVQAELRAYVNQPYRPVRRGEFYSAGWLTENEDLPYGRVLGNTAQPAIPELVGRTGASQYDEIAIEAPRRASYHVGDSLLILRLARNIAGWGDVVVPAGVARVTELQRRQVLAQVLPNMQFSRILGTGYLALPLEPFKDPGQVRPTPVEQGLEGQVIAERDFHALTISQQILFINRGRADGVTPGDMFEVYRPAAGLPGSASEEPALVIEVVHTREHSSSGLVLNVEHPDIVPGMPVRLIRKMPS
jgi:hypothetical protein